MGVNDPVALMRSMHGQYLAVSATILYGGYILPEATSPAGNLVAYLRTQQPVAQAGPLLIFDLAEDVRWASVQQEKIRLANRPPHRPQPPQ